MKIKKTMALFMAAVLGTAALTGCGSSEGDARGAGNGDRCRRRDAGG